MSLRDVPVRKEYRNLNCDVANDFYIPVLKEAVLYKRAVGFFNSSALYEIAVGLRHIAESNGKILLIVSPSLSDEDVKSIQLGYRMRDEIVTEAIVREIPEPQSEAETLKLNLLANLIACGVLDIKVAYKPDDSRFGIFHEKIGIIEDDFGNRIAFTGSMNETYSGLFLNYESIDVFCSWVKGDMDRVEIKDEAFSRLWNNQDSSICVQEFPAVAVEILDRYRRMSNRELFEREAELNSVSTQVSSPFRREKKTFFRIPANIILKDYQEEAVKAWEAQDFRGIFDMATGTGKTFTALGGLSRLSIVCGDKLGVFIVCPYQHLVEQWVEDIRNFGVEPIICYSRYDWKKKLKNTVSDYNRGFLGCFCVITTNATFALQQMQMEVARVRGDLCLVVDEAHNFGAKKQLDCMTESFRYRLALSATLERKYDETGTNRLKEYFGEKCIEYSLEKAIREGQLTPYYYYPVPVYFNEEELAQYAEITERIMKSMRGVNRDSELPEAVKRLLIERARIVARAEEKLTALKRVIEPYRKKNHLLVYCGATQVNTTKDTTGVDAGDMRQVEAVSRILGNEMNMIAARFTAQEDSRQRERIKSEYSAGRIQALVAIKCLDEGMNIPGIETAFILASSTNQKEYIQRRGRVLRKAPGKEYAEIYDFIVIPRPLDEESPPETKQAERSLIRRELERIRDFQALSENPGSVTRLVQELDEKYNLYELEEETYERF